MTLEAATDAALATWSREPLFHISSPRDGWLGPAPQRHHDFIDLRDFPACWESLDITVEIEAKAKEVAIARLRTSLARRARRRARTTG
jgi:UV DNA damage endonuclease